MKHLLSPLESEDEGVEFWVDPYGGTAETLFENQHYRFTNISHQPCWVKIHNETHIDFGPASCLSGSTTKEWIKEYILSGGI